MRREARFRTSNEPPTALWRHDLDAMRIEFHGQALAMTRYEYLLLALLLSATGRVFTREQIMSRVWAHAPDTDDRSIEIARGGDLGEVLDSEEALIAFFDRVAAREQPKPAGLARSEFLSNPGAAVPVALDLLDKLINDEIPRTLVQDSVYETYSSLRKRPAKPVVIGLRKALKSRLSRMFFGK